MTHTIIMRGAYAITDPRLGAPGVIPAGAVVITDGTIQPTDHQADDLGQRRRALTNPFERK